MTSKIELWFLEKKKPALARLAGPVRVATPHSFSRDAPMHVALNRAWRATSRLMAIPDDISGRPASAGSDRAEDGVRLEFGIVD
jgi:hypothetical protein